GAGIAMRLARTLHKSNISQAIWLALRSFGMRRLAMRSPALPVAVLGAVAALMAPAMTTMRALAAVIRASVMPSGRMVRRGSVHSAPRTPVRRRDRHADQTLDVAEKRPFLIIAERDRHALGAGTCGAADAMDVTLGDVGEV